MSINRYTLRTYNFSEGEFKCKDSDFGYSGTGFCHKDLPPGGVNPLLLEGLQHIRDYFGKPLIITSPYRCLAYNRAIKSSDGSYHVKGMAADIVVQGVKPLEVLRFIEERGIFTGRGYYPKKNFVHVDVRQGLLPNGSKSVTRWFEDNNGRTVVVDNFDDFLEKLS